MAGGLQTEFNVTGAISAGLSWTLALKKRRNNMKISFLLLLLLPSTTYAADKILTKDITNNREVRGWHR